MSNLRGTNLARALRASSWFYGSRSLLLVWALLLTRQFGISNYGLFAMAYSLGTMLSTPIDSYFVVRTARVSDEEFDGDRTTRILLGMGLAFVGWLLWPFTFVGGFAVGKAGVDVCFQASRSALIRSGRPDLTQRADALRQIAGFVLGAVYVLLYPGGTLHVAALVYLGGSATPILMGIRHLITHAPHVPELSARNVTIISESLAGVAYGNAGIVLLGLLDSSASAGYYAYGYTVLQGIASIGLGFAVTYHEPLREAQGAVEAGPPWRSTLLLGMACAGPMLLISLVLLISGVGHRLWLVFALLAPVALSRTIGIVSSVILLMQHRDLYRLLVTLLCLVIKVGLIALFSRFGGPAAAGAFLVADAVMGYAYGRAAYGPALLRSRGG